MSITTEDEPLYRPAHPEDSATFRFLARINAETGLSLKSYDDLYNWSTANIDSFWSAVWDTTNIIGYKGDHVVDTAATPPLNPAWFAVILIHAIPQVEDRSDWLPDWISWDTFLDEGRACKLGRTDSGEIEWVRDSFNTPLWILFSSGTTGKPK
ncbi:hypothetical protein H0H87_009062 [Tephrocybe sp. NHM501043]|nr:hypothetical protein H0H87_009062 [Tephrocybe sp. NHM501043]